MVSYLTLSCYKAFGNDNLIQYKKYNQVLSCTSQSKISKAPLLGRCFIGLILENSRRVNRNGGYRKPNARLLFQEDYLNKIRIFIGNVENDVLVELTE